MLSSLRGQRHCAYYEIKHKCQPLLDVIQHIDRLLGLVDQMKRSLFKIVADTHRSNHVHPRDGLEEVSVERRFGFDVKYSTLQNH